jgi:AP-3 complex subunit delta
VALLAFNKIVVTHAWLVAQQEDVILECIDSADISIRIKALDLVQGMVSSDNLISIVSRLMRQLKSASANDGNGVRPDPADFDSEDEAFERTNPSERAKDNTPPLPDDYRIDVINRILSMCSQQNYSNLTDFEWYIDILTQLVRTAPQPRPASDADFYSTSTKSTVGDVSERVGDELRNITVKVHAMRPACVEAAELIMAQFGKDAPIGHTVVSGALKPVAWIVGEFASETRSPEDSLGSLLQLISRTSAPESLAACLQAATKVFSLIAGDSLAVWTPERKTAISLLMARIIHAFEPLAMHPSLEVQERAVEFIELLKLTAEAVSGQDAASQDAVQEAPLLLTQAIPSLFVGWELNAVAPGAQKNVPFPEGLDLDEPINPNLNYLLASADSITIPADELDEFEIYYNKRPAPTAIASEPAITRLADSKEEVASSYQQPTEDSYLDADILARRKAERMERNRDDPFYIGEGSSLTGTSTPIHSILQNSNGPDFDVDSIPVMELDLNQINPGVSGSLPTQRSMPVRPKPRQRIVVTADETLAVSGSSTPRNYDSENNSDSFTKSRTKMVKQSVLLGVDSANIGSLNLEDDPKHHGYDYETKQREEAEMAQAVKEVERLRLEMQRANERIQVAQGVDAEGTVVKKKTKKKTTASSAGGEADAVRVKKKKKQSPAATTEESQAQATEGTSADTPVPDAVPDAVKPKKKKKARTVEIQD